MGISIGQSSVSVGRGMMAQNTDQWEKQNSQLMTYKITIRNSLLSKRKTVVKRRIKVHLFLGS